MVLLVVELCVVGVVGWVFMGVGDGLLMVGVVG